MVEITVTGTDVEAAKNPRQIGGSLSPPQKPVSAGVMPYYEDDQFRKLDDIEGDMVDVYTKQVAEDTDRDLQDLIQGLSPPKATDAQPEVPGVTTPDSNDDQPDEGAQQPQGDQNPLEALQNDGAQGNPISEFAKGVARGMGTTISTMSDMATSATVHGPLKAADSMLQLPDDLGIGSLADALEATIPLGGLQIYDADGNVDVQYLTPSELSDRKKAGEHMIKPGVPDALIDFFEPRTMAGDLSSSVGQFVTGFLVAGGVTKGVEGWTIAKNMGRAALADFMAFNGQEQHLSNILARSENPVFNNAVTQFLAQDDDSPEAVNRLKMAAEGVIAGALIDPFIRGLRYMKYLRRKKVADGKAATSGEASTTDVPGRDPDLLLGDPDAPLISDRPTGAWVELQKYLNKEGNLKQAQETVEGVAKTAEDAKTTKTIPSGAEPIKLGDKPVYINFAHINTGEDVHAVIQYLSNEAAKNINRAKRGTVTWEESGVRASQMNAWDLLMSRKRGDPLREDQLLAARELWVSSADKVMRLSQLAARDGTPEAIFAARRMVSIFQMINQQVLGAQSEAGRALQILKKPVGVDGTHMAKFISDALASTGGMDANLEFFRNIAKLGDDPTGYAKLIDKTEPKTMERIIGGIQDFWIGGSLLTGPKTFLRNFVSNLSVTINEAVERGIAGQANDALGLGLANAPTDGLKYITGALSAIKQAVGAAGKAAYYNRSAFGRTQFDMGGHIRASSKGTLLQGTPLGWAIDALGAYSSISSRILVSTDDFFKTLNYTGELSVLAHQRARDELRTGKIRGRDYKDRVGEIMADPPYDIAQKAYDQAHYATFTSPPGDITKSLLRIAQVHPSIRWIMPFMTTPANLFKYSMERSPLGFMTKRYKDAIDAGGSEALMARTRLGWGTMVNLVALDLAIEGKLIGDVGSPTSSTSPGQQEWERRNLLPFSVMVGDRMFSYSGTDPLGFTLGINAQIGSVVRATSDNDMTDEENEELARAISSSIFFAANYAMSRSYMTGLSDFMDGVNDPKSAGPAYFRKLGTSFVPAWMNEANRAMDPVLRDGSTFVNAFNRRMLFQSEGVPAVMDRFGRTTDLRSGLGVLYDVTSPFYSKKYQPSVWELEERRQGFYVAPPSKVLTIDGVRVSLSTHPDLYQRLKQLRGMKPSEMGDGKYAKRLLRKYGDTNLLDLLGDMVQGNNKLFFEYHDATDGPGNEKDDMVDGIVSEYGKAAREALIDESPEIKTLINREKARMRQRDLNVDAN